MSKPTKKRRNYNEDILTVLASRYGYSLDYIRKSLRGDRVGEMPDILKNEYKAMDAEAKKAIKEKCQTLQKL